MRLPLNVLPQDILSAAERRSCGPCTACCVLPRIGTDEDSLPLLPQGKLGYTACEHLGCDGCTRYDERPPVCREFQCLWRSGYISGDERRRPDNLGLMFTVEMLQGKFIVEAWELWEGAARDHPGRGVLDAIASRTTVTLRFWGVPCSLEYNRPEHLLQGQELSRLAREEPRKLAEWLETAVRERWLDDPEDIIAQMEVEHLRGGRCVLPHDWSK